MRPTMFILRMVLGIILCAKGISFIHDSALLDRLLYGDTSVAENATHWLPILVTCVDLLCGLFIMIGIIPRLAAAVQIPFLLVAVVFVITQKAAYAPSYEIYLAIIALLLCIVLILLARRKKASP